MRLNRVARTRHVSDFTHGKAPVQATTTGAVSYSPTGLLLAATSSQSGDLLFNSAIKAANFDAEIVMRRRSPASASGNLQFRFRYQDGSNLWKAHLTDFVFALDKLVGGVQTRVSITNYPGIVAVPINGSLFNRVRVRAIGPSIEVYLNGIKVLSANDSAFATKDQFTFSTFDSTSGNARMEVSYLAIRRL